MSMLSPRRAIIMAAIRFFKDSSKEKDFTIDEVISVRRKKLSIKPSTIPVDFRLLPREEEKIIGIIGQMHGAKTVAKPDKNANGIKINIK
jgi:hypothetical protein